MHEALEIAVLALSPIIPHVTHALWRALGHTEALIDEPWPAGRSRRRWNIDDARSSSR